jgi:hypothetical protein
MERPFMPEDISSCLYRDWPDSRGIWVNNDRTLVSFINRRDHIVLSSIENTNDFKQIFTKFADFISKVMFAN